MNATEVVAKLRPLGNPAALDGMARHGIATANALGVSMPARHAILHATSTDGAARWFDRDALRRPAQRPAADRFKLTD